jgi:tRNA pseudouridine38-40 synthase
LKAGADMPKWKLIIEYEGTRYRGWQEQTNARTVQGELRKAAEQVFGRTVEIVGAGRTDAGVHALHQVAHLKSSMPIRETVLRREMNDRLPSDISIRDAREVPPRFHARHHAAERFYLYQIATRRMAFGKPFVWWIKDELDVEAMSSAASFLLGRHDFSTFREKDEKPTSTIVVVTRSELMAQDDLILFRIGASHFLWKMVRRIVGVLVEIGRGKFPAADMERLLSDDSMPVSQWTSPPSGLFLEYVQYPGDKPPGPLVPAFICR